VTSHKLLEPTSARLKEHNLRGRRKEETRGTHLEAIVVSVGVETLLRLERDEPP
jgi:hypothetical protein